MSSLTDRVVDIETIYAQQTGLTREGTDLAIHHLQRTKRAALLKYTSIDGRDVTMAKIAIPNKFTEPISDEERKLFDINLTIIKKTKQIEDMENQIEEVDTELRELVRNKKKNLAGIKLRKKKNLEAQLGNS